MAEYYVLADDFGAEIGLVDENTKPPEGAKIVKNEKRADEALEKAIVNAEKVAAKFEAEADKEIPKEEVEKPVEVEKPGKRKPGKEKQ